MAGQRRAHADDEKQARRELLLAVAADRFRAHPYGEVTIAQVADDAGLAKGTVYLYFRTKEELFLALTESELAAFFDAVDPVLDEARGPTEAAEAVAAAIVARPVLPRLLPLLHGVFEHNVDADRARAFKLFLRDRVAVTAPKLERALDLAPGAGVGLLLTVHALVVGFGGMADPAPVLRPLLAEPDLAAFVIDLERDLTRALRAQFLGIQRMTP